MWRALTLAVVSVALGGCANFRAVSEFAQQTAKVTAVVRVEVQQLDSICVEQAELTIVLNGGGDEGPLKACGESRQAQGRLAGVTLDVLDEFARVLNGLADDSAFDLDSDIDNVGAKLQSLRDRAGNSIVSDAEVTAIVKVAQLIADIATQAKREAAVRRLVQEKQYLATLGRILRSYFAADPQAPPGRAKPAYVNLVALNSDALALSEAMLGSGAFKRAEPIRTVEHLRGLRARKAELQARSGPTAPVPVAIVEAHDAWQAALDAFSEDALKPDPKAFADRLKQLRTKAKAARDAVRAANV